MDYYHKNKIFVLEQRITELEEIINKKQKKTLNEIVLEKENEELKKEIRKLNYTIKQQNIKIAEIERAEFYNKKNKEKNILCDNLKTENSKLMMEVLKLKQEIKGLKIKKEKRKNSASKLKSGKKYKEFRQKILERDKYKCVECGSHEKLQVHHIKSVHKYPELVMDENNVITLCASCHVKTDNYLQF